MVRSWTSLTGIECNLLESVTTLGVILLLSGVALAITQGRET